MPLRLQQHLPGDELPIVSEDVKATTAGILLTVEKKQLYVNNARIYFPRVGDLVVGTIIGAHSEGYRVNVNSAFEAYLPLDAFNNATKANRPKLAVGDHIFCRVTWAGVPPLNIKIIDEEGGKPRLERGEPFLPPLQTYLEAGGGCDVSCVVPSDTRGWATGQVYLGHLVGEFAQVVNLPVRSATFIQHGESYALQLLGETLKFEIAAGANGRVWINGADAATVVCVNACLARAANLSDAEAHVFISLFIKRLREAIEAPTPIAD